MSIPLGPRACKVVRVLKVYMTRSNKYTANEYIRRATVKLNRLAFTSADIYRTCVRMGWKTSSSNPKRMITVLLCNHPLFKTVGYDTKGNSVYLNPYFASPIK